jgi:tyrosine-protein kinase
MAREEIVDLRSIFAIIKRRIWLVVGCGLLAGAVAFIAVSTVPASYRATTTMLIMVSKDARIDEYNTLVASERLALTYSQMLTERSLLEAVIAREGLTQTPEALARKISARPVQNTQLIRLTATDSSPTRAAQIANALAEEFTARIRTLRGERSSSYTSNLESKAQAQDDLVRAAQQRFDELTAQQITSRAEVERQQSLLDGYTNDYKRLQLDLQARPSAVNEAQADRLSRLIKETQDKLGTATSEKLRSEIELARQERILTQAETEQSALQEEVSQMRRTEAQDADAVAISERASVPEEPTQNRLTYLLLAAVLAVTVALGIAFLVEFMAQTIKTPEEIDSLLMLKTVGQIGQFSTTENELLVVAQPESPVAQSFRMLAASIRFLQADSPIRTLLVTSATSGEGKSVVVANLAVALAMSGLRVAAVDADFRRARLHRLFGLFKADGLSESLESGSIDGNLQQTRVAGLEVLTCGTPPADPTSLIGSPNLAKLLADIGVNADIVVIDGPPVLPLADSAILAQTSDAVLLVVRADYTHEAAAVQAVEMLRQTNSRLVGAVLTAVPAASYDYYNTAYRYQDHTKRQKPASRLSLRRITWRHRRGGSSQ